MKKFLAIVQNENTKQEACIPIYADNDCTKNEALTHYSIETGRKIGVADRFGAILVRVEETNFNERIVLEDTYC